MATTGHVPALGFHAGAIKYVVLFGFSPNPTAPGPGNDRTLNFILESKFATTNQISAPYAQPTVLTSGYSDSDQLGSEY